MRCPRINPARSGPLSPNAKQMGYQAVRCAIDLTTGRQETTEASSDQQNRNVSVCVVADTGVGGHVVGLDKPEYGGSPHRPEGCDPPGTGRLMCRVHRAPPDGRSVDPPLEWRVEPLTAVAISTHENNEVRRWPVRG